MKFHLTTYYAENAERWCCFLVWPYTLHECLGDLEVAHWIGNRLFWKLCVARELTWPESNRKPGGHCETEENFLQFGRSYHQLSRRWKKLFCSYRWTLKRHYNSTESPEVDEKASWCPSDQWWRLQQILKFLFFAMFSHFSIFNTHNQNIYLPKTKKMTDSAKTLVLLRKHSILNVYERGSIYLDHKQFYSGGFRLMCHPAELLGK